MSPLVAEIIGFLENRSKRYYCVPPLRKGDRRDDDSS